MMRLPYCARGRWQCNGAYWKSTCTVDVCIDAQQLVRRNIKGSATEIILGQAPPTGHVKMKIWRVRSIRSQVADRHRCGRIGLVRDFDRARKNRRIAGGILDPGIAFQQETGRPRSAIGIVPRYW